MASYLILSGTVRHIERPRPLSLAEVAARSIHRTREQRGLAQRDLARWMTMLGFDWKGTTVSRIESGDRGVRADELAAIALCLRVPLVDLWRLEDADGQVVAGGLSTTGTDLRDGLINGDGPATHLPHAEVEHLAERLLDDPAAVEWVDSELARWAEAQELLRKPVTEHRLRAKRASLWAQYRTREHDNEERTK